MDPIETVDCTKTPCQRVLFVSRRRKATRPDEATDLLYVTIGRLQYFLVKFIGPNRLTFR